MYKTALAPAFRRPSPLSETVGDYVQVQVIIARDDEIYDVGNDHLTFTAHDNEKPFCAMAVKNLLGFTTDDWIVHGLSVSESTDSPVYWFKGTDFLSALQELGFTEFDYLEGYL